MELKWVNFLDKTRKKLTSSNRTFMELKFYRNAENICAQCRSNRTFMELKFQSSNLLALSLLMF